MQYYAVYSGSYYNPDADDPGAPSFYKYAPYEGSIRSVSGEAIIGLVPEPTTAALLLIAAPLALRRRRKRDRIAL